MVRELKEILQTLHNIEERANEIMIDCMILKSRIGEMTDRLLKGKE